MITRIPLSFNGNRLHGMARDISGAIVNTNEDDYISFKSKRDSVNKEKEELAAMKSEIRDIKDMLTIIMQKLT